MSPFGHILLVEDNVDLREVMALLLESEGHQVLQAGDGSEALQALAAANPVRLIILDLMMPVMDGPTFLAHKARGAHAAVPVVIFSSTPSAELKSWPFVVCAVPKVQGIEGLLAAIRRVDSVSPASGSSS